MSHGIVYDNQSTSLHTVSSPTDPWYPYRGPYTTNITIDGKLYVFHNYAFEVESSPSSFAGSTTFSQMGAVSLYCYNNQTLGADLTPFAQCLPETYFVWGFSSLLIYIVLSLQITWTLGMYLVWLDANIYGALCRSGRKVRGNFRAALDLSEAIGEILGPETCAYSDEELTRELARQPGIGYYSNDAQKGDVSHIGLSSRRIGRVEYNSTKLYGRRSEND